MVKYNLSLVCAQRTIGVSGTAILDPLLVTVMLCGTTLIDKREKTGAEDDTYVMAGTSFASLYVDSCRPTCFSFFRNCVTAIETGTQKKKKKKLALVTQFLSLPCVACSTF